MQRREHRHRHVGGQPHSLAAGDGHQLVGRDAAGSITRIVSYEPMTVAPVRRAMRSAPHRWSKWEWPTTIQSARSMSSALTGGCGPAAPGHPVDVRVEEDDEVARQRQPERGAPVPVERCGHAASITRPPSAGVAGVAEAE